MGFIVFVEAGGTRARDINTTEEERFKNKGHFDVSQQRNHHRSNQGGRQ